MAPLRLVLMVPHVVLMAPHVVLMVLHAVLIVPGVVCWDCLALFPCL